MPERIQRKRTKGWRMPADTVSVTRPGKWGNPFNWKDGVEVGGPAWAKAAAVELFDAWLRSPDRFPDQPSPPTVSEIREALQGKNLACFCSVDEPCHADVLLKLANRPSITLHEGRSE